MRNLTSRALVQVADRSFEIQEFRVPSSLPDDYALLRVEANGVCGSDYAQYCGELTKSGIVTYPVIPGHEPLGRVEWIGERAREALDVAEGDRVVVDSLIPCGRCPECKRGFQTVCSKRFAYGYVPTSVPPSLWGGMSEYLILRPGTILHHLPEHIATEDAAYQNALAAGFEWTVRIGHVGVGDRVLIWGPGQRGLACVIAAVEAGASEIIVAGLSRDKTKLDIARDFGATATINIEEEPVRELVDDITNGEGIERIIDVTPHAIEPITTSIDVASRGAVIVLAGLKGMRKVNDLISDHIVLKALRLQGVMSTSLWSKEQAIRVLSTSRYPFEFLHTHIVPLELAEEGILTLGGEVPGEEAIHVTIDMRR